MPDSSTALQASATPKTSANIVFFGSDAIALPLLQWLHKNGGANRPFTLCGVISQPDRKSGRGQKLQPNPISAYAMEAGIPLLRPQKPDAELTAWLQAQNVQLALVMAYGHILKKSLLAAVPLGFVNFHASLLPAYRGASPVETAVACAETFTGVSLMRIVPKMDAGPVLAVETVAIDHARAETGADIRHKLAEACVPLIDHNIDALLSEQAAHRFVAQDESQASYCRKLDKSDGQLDLNAPAAALAARINGLFPWPGCYLDFQGERLKVAQAFAEALPPLPHNTIAHSTSTDNNEAAASAPPPGTVLGTDKEGLRIVTADGVLKIGRLQKAGGKMLPAHEFTAGTPLPEGERLTGGAMRPLRQSGPKWEA